VTKACSADIPKLCAGQTGGAVMRCLRQNLTSVSATCSAQLQRSGRGGRGGGAGGGGGFGGAP
jgi:Cysteine rich repeat